MNSIGRKQAAWILTVWLILLLGGCASKKAETVVPGKFTVGFDQEFPPMGFMGEDGEFTGFDLDLAAEVARRLDLKLQLQPIKWDSKDMELSAGNIDCIWNGFTINGLENKYTWTDPYMSNQQVFLVNSDSGIESLADLEGKTVAVQVDSSAETALKDNPELTDSFQDVITASDYNSALMDLKAGGVDAVAMDEIVADYRMKKEKNQFTVLKEKLTKEEYGVGFRLGNTVLRDKVQNALEDMAKDGSMKTISKKWFGKDITVIEK